jgi:type IV pilus assembly protein PilO
MKLEFKNLPIAAKIGIPIIPAILIGVAVFFLVYTPKQEEINKISAAISKQKDEIAKKQMDVKDLPIKLAQLAEVQKRFNEIKYQLPLENEVSDLLKQVSDNASQNNVPILSWSPVAKKKKTTAGMRYLEIPVNITIKGSYHNLGNFFASLTSIDRIINIQDIKLTSPNIQNKVASLSISFSAVTYSTLPDPPPVVKQKVKTKKPDETKKPEESKAK